MRIKYFVLVAFLSSYLFALPSEPHWRFDMGGGFQVMNFFPGWAPDIFVQGQYEEKKKYLILSRFEYINRFEYKTYSTSLGGGCFVIPQLLLMDTFIFAPGAIVVPQVQNKFEAVGELPYGLSLYGRYVYSHYSVAKVHNMNPGLTWYFASWGTIDSNFIFSIKDFGGSSLRYDPAVLTQFTWMPFGERYQFFMKYAWTQESFNAGNPEEYRRFRSNHFGGGFLVSILESLGGRLDYSYERRDNGQTVTTWMLSLFYKT